MTNSFLSDIMKIVFSDLDETLLDHETYSFAPVQSGLTLLKNKKIPLILCSSKTRAEILYWQKELNIYHPFISENGGGIYIPQTYFSMSFQYTDKTDSYYRIQLGTPYAELSKTMQEMEQRFHVQSMMSMDLKILQACTNLSKKQAKLARKREHDIPFLLSDSSQLNKITRFIEQQNLYLTKGGRFYHLIGDNDKGKAVNQLITLYHQQYGQIKSIGIGDSENDFPMLSIVDKPYLVKKKDGRYASNEFFHVDGIGPMGFQEMIDQEFSD